MNDGVAICVDVRPARHRAPHRAPLPRRPGRQPGRRAAPGGRGRATRAAPLSIGVLGNAAEVLPELLRRGCADRHRDRPDQRARPAGLPAARRRVRRHGRDCAREKPADFTDRARESMARHVEAMVGFLDAGAEVFDYGNSIRGEAQPRRVRAGVRLPRASCRPTSGRCSARARARSAGRRCPATRPTSRPPTAAILDLFPENESLARWIRLAGERVALPGPARPDLLARLRRARPGRRAVQRHGRLRRAVRARSSSAATTSTAARSPRPYRETEAMLDGSDAIADWPLLNAMVNVASGASWVSIHHGGGVGIGRSIHAGPGDRRRRHAAGRREDPSGC